MGRRNSSRSFSLVSNSLRSGGLSSGVPVVEKPNYISGTSYLIYDHQEKNITCFALVSILIKIGRHYHSSPVVIFCLQPQFKYITFCMNMQPCLTAFCSKGPPRPLVEVTKDWFLSIPICKLSKRPLIFSFHSSELPKEKSSHCTGPELLWAERKINNVHRGDRSAFDWFTLLWLTHLQRESGEEDTIKTKLGKKTKQKQKQHTCIHSFFLKIKMGNWRE